MKHNAYKRAELLKTPVNAKFDSEALWRNAALVTTSEDISNRMSAASRGGHDFGAQLSFVEARAEDSHDISGLLAFTRWILTRRVNGPKFRAHLHSLLKWEYSQLNKCVEEKDRQFLSLAERIRRLPLADSVPGKARSLGDLVPEKFLFRTGKSETNLKLTRMPPRSLVMNLMPPRTEAYLLQLGQNPEVGPPSAFKGCTPCQPDPESSLGGSQYCIGPDSESWRECEWPPQQTTHPPLQWEYIVQVGNSWWTTFLGVWHGSGYTRTVMRAGSTTLPWDVPALRVSIEPAASDVFANDWCFGVICDHGCGEVADAFNAHEVSASDTQLSTFGSPWGMDSKHGAANLGAIYCDGKWSWY